MTILVTGAAGFIGYHLSLSLLMQGEKVTGIDNLNDYYDVGLSSKRGFLSLSPMMGFRSTAATLQTEMECNRKFRAGDDRYRSSCGASRRPLFAY